MYNNKLTRNYQSYMNIPSHMNNQLFNNNPLFESNIFEKKISVSTSKSVQCLKVSLFLAKEKLEQKTVNKRIKIIFLIRLSYQILSLCLQVCPLV